MIPENSLSSEPVIANIFGGRAKPVSAMQDYEDGGIALNDASEGLLYQIWLGFSDGENIYVKAPNTPQTLVYSGADITEFSFTFDQNMRIVIVFMQNGIAKLYWYDSTIEGYATTAFEAGARCPKVFLDDKRASQTGNSDVLLFYMSGNELCYRQQRDRFGERYVLTDVASDYPKENKRLVLINVGMGKNWRIQFTIM